MSRREMTLKEAITHIQDMLEFDEADELAYACLAEEDKEDMDKFLFGISFMMQFFKTMEKQKKLKLDKITIKY